MYVAGIGLSYLLCSFSLFYIVSLSHLSRPVPLYTYLSRTLYGAPARILSTITERTENPSSRPTSYNFSMPRSRPVPDVIRHPTMLLHSQGAAEARIESTRRPRFPTTVRSCNSTSFLLPRSARADYPPSSAIALPFRRRTGVICRRRSLPETSPSLTDVN